MWCMVCGVWYGTQCEKVGCLFPTMRLKISFRRLAFRFPPRPQGGVYGRLVASKRFSTSLPERGSRLCPHCVPCSIYWYRPLCVECSRCTSMSGNIEENWTFCGVACGVLRLLIDCRWSSRSSYLQDGQTICLKTSRLKVEEITLPSAAAVVRSAAIA